MNAVMAAQPPDHGAFEKFLLWLSPDRPEALRKYDEIMRKIIKYLVRKGCPEAEELAGETRDRVIKIVNAGAEYHNPIALFHGVARNVWREYTKVFRPEPLTQDPPASPQDTEYKELQAHCLDICLGKLPDSEHDLITRYYQGTGRGKVEARKLLAAEHGGENTLRIKTFRIRARLRVCLDDCMSQRAVN